ncbi:MAG: ABC transporter substrate-binding protein [Bacillati bacterium ANGP1]|uniref:ABC transporter substrate-binding protein n=1 Tax=Candidatus Segetimicrobium genomatis TaxID=2569760 RepID=A0A537KC84_9BACT|nr:MAG: ABC transporter substrate-binding protein [Terrabacteria group bacterium ANGP1]
MAARIARRALLKGGVAVAGATAAAGLERLRPLVYAQTAPAAPIRIGFLADITGTVAQSGRDMLDGFQLYLAERGSVMAGRQVQLIVEDAGGVPANALTKARKMVEQDRVHLLTAPLLASEGYAIRDYIVDRNVPTLFAVSSADDLTQRKRAPNLVRTGWASSQPSHPFGEWVAATLKYKKVATVGSDYAFGYEVVGGFQRTFELHGGEIVQKLWAPLGTPDFSPYVTQIRRDVDAVFAIPVGADVLRFVKAYRQYGLKDRLPLVGGGLLTDESNIRGMDLEDAAGIITPLMWSAALSTPQARKFVEAYTARYHKDPSYYAETNYSGAMWVEAAVQQLGGKVEDKEAFLRALRAVQLPNAPRGPMRLDAYQNVIQNVYVRKVDVQGGHAANAVIDTFHNVSQFWKFPPEEFLRQPVYDRGYPPCRYCG